MKLKPPPPHPRSLRALHCSGEDGQTHSDLSLRPRLPRWQYHGKKLTWAGSRESGAPGWGIGKQSGSSRCLTEVTFVQDSGDQMAEDISHHCKTFPFTLSEKGAPWGFWAEELNERVKNVTQASKKRFLSHLDQAPSWTEFFTSWGGNVGRSHAILVCDSSGFEKNPDTVIF